MKKIYMLILALASFQVLNAQTIPNGDLENWYNVEVNPTLNYDQPGTGPTDNWITTLNELAAIPAPIGPGPVTVFKTTEAHTGTYAAKLVSANFPLIPNDVFIPGMLGTCQMLMTQNRALLGRSCVDCKPEKLIGYVKSFPVNNDSTIAVILVSKWNATTKHRDTIGFGSLVFKGNISEYEKFEVPVDYYTGEASDSLTILCVSSAGFSAVNFMGGIGQVGSTMYIDDLVLENANGIQQSLMPEVGVKTWPNPASSVLHVELTQPLKSGTLEVYDINGKHAATFSTTGTAFDVPVSGFSSGTWYFRLMEGKSLYNTGSFVIAR